MLLELHSHRLHLFLFGSLLGRFALMLILELLYLLISVLQAPLHVFKLGIEGHFEIRFDLLADLGLHLSFFSLALEIVEPRRVGFLLHRGISLGLRLQVVVQRALDLPLQLLGLLLQRPGDVLLELLDVRLVLLYSKVRFRYVL